jgi:hypothetical protein
VKGFLAAILLLGAVDSANAQTTRRGDTIFVSDRYLTAGATGAELIAKFDTAAARTSMLRLDAPVATINGRAWVLGDILVSLDLNGNGYVARWMVAGPRNVVEEYLARFRTITRQRSPIYDSGIHALIVRCACD